MNKIQKKIIIAVVFIAFLSIIIGYIFNKFNNENKDKYLYNIGNIQDINEDIVTNGVAIFDEYVLENFSGIDIVTDNYRIYRADSIVEGTNNFDASTIANKLFNLSNTLVINDSINDKKIFNKIKNSIFSNEINSLNINYFNNINLSVSNSESTVNYLENYIKNKTVKVDSSGYLLNYYDGFESLLDYNDIEKNNWEFLKSSTNNNSSKIAGLKFVNNKHYFIATYIDNLYRMNKKSLSSASLTIKNRKYRASLHDYSPFNEGYIAIFKMYDGLEKFLENRFFRININFDTKQGFKIPKEAIVSLKGINGVYYLDNSIIKFTPISIIKENGNEVYITNNFDYIFPEIISESHIEFNKLSPFTKIILNPEKYNEGDIY